MPTPNTNQKHENVSANAGSSSSSRKIIEQAERLKERLSIALQQQEQEQQQPARSARSGGDPATPFAPLMALGGLCSVGESVLGLQKGSITDTNASAASVSPRPLLLTTSSARKVPLPLQQQQQPQTQHGGSGGGDGDLSRQSSIRSSAPVSTPTLPLKGTDSRAAMTVEGGGDAAAPPASSLRRSSSRHNSMRLTNGNNNSMNTNALNHQRANSSNNNNNDGSAARRRATTARSSVGGSSPRRRGGGGSGDVGNSALALPLADSSVDPAGQQGTSITSITLFSDRVSRTRRGRRYTAQSSFSEALGTDRVLATIFSAVADGELSPPSSGIASRNHSSAFDGADDVQQRGGGGGGGAVGGLVGATTAFAAVPKPPSHSNANTNNRARPATSRCVGGNGGRSGGGGGGEGIFSLTQPTSQTPRGVRGHGGDDDEHRQQKQQRRVQSARAPPPSSSSTQSAMASMSKLMGRLSSSSSSPTTNTTSSSSPFGAYWAETRQREVPLHMTRKAFENVKLAEALEEAVAKAREEKMKMLRMGGDGADEKKEKGSTSPVGRGAEKPPVVAATGAAGTPLMNSTNNNITAHTANQPHQELIAHSARLQKALAASVANQLLQTASPLEERMLLEHSTLMFGSNRNSVIPIAQLKERVDEKLNLVREDPLLQKDVRARARSARQARIENYRAHDFVQRRVDEALRELKQQWAAVHGVGGGASATTTKTSAIDANAIAVSARMDEAAAAASRRRRSSSSNASVESAKEVEGSAKGGEGGTGGDRSSSPSPTSAATTTAPPSSSGAGGAAGSGEPLVIKGILHPDLDDDGLPKIPIYLLEKVKHDAYHAAVAEQQEIYSHSGDYTQQKNEERRLMHAENLARVTREKEERILELVTRHDRTVAAAEAERKRLQHSPLKAQWMELIVFALFQQHISNRGLKIIACKHVKYHREMFYDWFHRWHDPTLRLLTAKRKRLARAKIFLALIITRMWGSIAVRRRKALLVRQYLRDVKEAGKLQVGVHRFIKGINKVMAVIKRFLFLRTFSLQLTFMQFLRYEKEFLEIKEKEIIAEDQKRYEEEELMSRSRAGRAAKAKANESRRSMTKEQQDIFRITELVTRDRTPYTANGKFHFPFVLVAPHLMAAWHEQRRTFLNTIQPKLFAEDMKAYNQKMLKRATLSAAEMSRTPIPKPPTLRTAPRLLPPDTMRAIVQKVHREYEDAVLVLRRGAALQAVQDNMECNYPMLRDRMTNRHFGINESIFNSNNGGVGGGGDINDVAKMGFKVAFGDVSHLLSPPQSEEDIAAEKLQRKVKGMATRNIKTLANVGSTSPPSSRSMSPRSPRGGCVSNSPTQQQQHHYTGGVTPRLSPSSKKFFATNRTLSPTALGNGNGGGASRKASGGGGADGGGASSRINSLTHNIPSSTSRTPSPVFPERKRPSSSSVGGGGGGGGGGVTTPTQLDGGGESSVASSFYYSNSAASSRPATRGGGSRPL